MVTTGQLLLLSLATLLFLVGGVVSLARVWWDREQMPSRGTTFRVRCWSRRRRRARPMRWRSKCRQRSKAANTMVNLPRKADLPRFVSLLST